MTEIRLRLSWQATWPGRENDFVSHAPSYEGVIGRILSEDGGARRLEWAWLFPCPGA